MGVSVWYPLQFFLSCAGVSWPLFVGMITIGLIVGAFVKGGLGPCLLTTVLSVAYILLFHVL